MWAELMKSKFVRHPSSVRPSVASIISEAIPWMSFKFLVVVSLGHMPRRFLNFWKKKIFYECFSFSLTWDPIGAKTSKRYSSLKSLLNPFKPFLNFFSVVLTKAVLNVWNFEFLIFQDFCFVFVNMGHYGSENFKRLLLLQMTFESFHPFPEFSSQWSSQKNCFGFLKI